MKSISISLSALVLAGSLVAASPSCPPDSHSQVAGAVYCTFRYRNLILSSYVHLVMTNDGTANKVVAHAIKPDGTLASRNNSFSFSSSPADTAFRNSVNPPGWVVRYALWSLEVVGHLGSRLSLRAYTATTPLRPSDPIPCLLKAPSKCPATISSPSMSVHLALHRFPNTGLHPVQSGSNTLSMFEIDELDPTSLRMIGTPVGSGGEFPMALTASPKTSTGTSFTPPH